MFIKTCKSIKNGKTYFHYQIVSSYRENGKIKHKLIANLGTPSEQDINSLIKGLNRLKKEPLPLEQAQLLCRKIVSFGEFAVLDHIWQKMDISTIIHNSALALPQLQFDIAPYIKLMVFQRLIDPGSELHLAENFKDMYFPELDILEYHKLLRSLGYVIRIKDGIEKQLFEKQKDIFHLDVDVVFYDITSTYFEADGPAIAKKGYSRDKRSDCNQVLIALAITKEGYPIGHEVLEGNLLDKSTVKQAIDKLKNRFSIDTCIFVGDRGMVSTENIHYIEKQGYRYIFAIKRRRIYETEEILEPDLNKYSELIEYDVDGNEKRLKYLEVTKEGKRYFICHNEERAKSDLIKLEKKIGKINKQIEDITKGNHSADALVKRFSRIYNLSRFYKYGLNNKNEFYYEFKEEAFAYEKLIAGKYVIKTNEQMLSGIEIIRVYKNLSRIESSFRDMKDFIEIRPIYHKKEENVRGHIFIAVLAYMMEKVLESYFSSEGKNRITARRILGHLARVKLVINEVNDYTFGTLTESTEEVKEILKKTGLKKFQDIYYLQKKEVKLPELTRKKLAKYAIL